MQTARLNLTDEIGIKQGATYRLPLFFEQSNGTPLNLTGATAAAQIRKNLEATVAVAFAVSFVDRLGGEIELALTKEQTLAMATGKYGWDLFITLSNGDVWAALEGEAIVKGRFTRVPA